MFFDVSDTYTALITATGNPTDLSESPKHIVLLSHADVLVFNRVHCHRSAGLLFSLIAIVMSSQSR